MPSFLLLLALVGCGAAQRPLPYPPSMLRADSESDAGGALVHYLGQPEADEAVCSLDGPQRVLLRFDADDFEELLDGLDEYRVAPERWARCTRRLLPGLAPPVRGEAVALMAHLFVERAEGADPREQTVASVLHHVLVTRPAGLALPLEVEPELRRLTSTGNHLASSLLESLEMDRGRYRGRPVTPELLKSVDDEELLRRFAARLPDPGLRSAARARIVDLHIAASPFAWVRAHESATRQRVLRTGRNAIPVRMVGDARHRPAHPGGVVVVHQEVRRQTSRLSFRTQRGASIVPALDLRGALQFAVDGIDIPITLCGPAELLDVSPCVDSRAIMVGTEVAALDTDGVLHFTESLGRDALLAIVERGPNLTLPLGLPDRELVAIEWPLAFARPNDVVYGAGEDLAVRIEETRGRLVIWFTEVPNRSERVVVVEPGDALSFAVVSRGRPGAAGADGAAGTAGAAGSQGMSASCPGSPGGSGGNGGNGGPGGNGGAGGPGGPGGDVVVTVACAPAACGGWAARARAMVQSQGGPGGPGGRGGPGGSGGQGGSGGSGTSCYDSQTGQSTSVSGGSSGSNGSQGSSGSNGPAGPNGRPGEVHVAVQTIARERPPAATGTGTAPASY